MCIHTVSTQYMSPFCILKCALSAQTRKNLQIWSTLVDHLYMQKSPARTLIGPNGGRNGLKSKNGPQKWKILFLYKVQYLCTKYKNSATNCTCSWVALVELLLRVCHLFHLWGYQASTQGGWSWSSCPRAALCALLCFLREHQALIPWQNFKDMASSSQEAHTHTHKEKLSLSLSHTQRYGGQSFFFFFFT